ncbi:hypothetical protein ACFQFQ_28385 [Sulfitobacter porphyrae]|uniref:Uncharacterized protein n=1 Tax=Sulfitobacter porphyrae TaxID=1246864 RepID=A0ABW2BBF7_9RHOB
MPLRSFGIGDGGDVQTDTAAWLELYGLTRTGAVLIRPDGHVAWRSARAGDPAELIAACLTAAAPRPRPFHQRQISKGRHDAHTEDTDSHRHLWPRRT